MGIILKELWYGNIIPQEKRFSQNENYKETLKIMCQCEEKLISVLENKEKEIFDKFCESRNELELWNQEEVFVTGFRLGAKIITESLYENEDNNI